ncbi:MAG: hypothetical protein VB098_07150 [Petrimonas sp.]|nr:hypothetical protein [Petrimonas sp.]
MPSEGEFYGVAVKQGLSYDARGRLRNPSTQVAYAPGISTGIVIASIAR